MKTQDTPDNKSPDAVRLEHVRLFAKLQRRCPTMAGVRQWPVSDNGRLAMVVPATQCVTCPRNVGGAGMISGPSARTALTRRSAWLE